MALPEPPESTRSAESDAPPADLATAAIPPPEPEPYTPERALEWNRYYDRYVAGGVLLLVFFVTAHKITANASSIWPMLKAGELIARGGAPLTTDPFSFTAGGQRWVNVPWAFDVAAHSLYSLGSTLFTADEATGAQIGAGVLVALTALARLLTAWILLRYRRPGPGLWWFAVVTAVAFGCVYALWDGRFEWSVGGIARQAIVGSAVWGHLLLAAVVLFMDRAFELGKTWALIAIPIAFLIWANIDESFALGLILLAAGTIGTLLDRRADRVHRPGAVQAIAVVLAAIAACVANPSTYHVFPVAFAPILAIPKGLFGSGTTLPMPEYLAYFGRDSYDFLVRSATIRDDQSPRLLATYYLAIAISGLASFALERRRPNFLRLALYLAAAAAWAGLARLSAQFAVVFVYAVGLNGQEWYQRRYGNVGRISPGWTAWSVGGRAVTILATFLVIAKTLTAYGYTSSRPTFGFGVEASDFDFDAAESIKTSGLTGRVMNLSESTGDSIIWRAYPQRKTFIDHRRGLFGPQVRDDLTAFRKAFDPVERSQGGAVAIPDSPEAWAPILDKYEVSAVVLSPGETPNVYLGMSQSKNWVPVRDDGRTVLFGRNDPGLPEALKPDLAYFQANRLDAAQMAYRRKQLVPFPDRAPSAMTFIDRIIRTRSVARHQPHVDAASRWMAAGAAASKTGLPDAAHCLMAIREVRIALARNPDDAIAYRLLEEAYEALMANEAAALANKLTSNPREYSNFRARQRITALNYAIQTTPPPQGLDERRELAGLYYKLALLYRSTGDLDLERDSLAQARDLFGVEDFAASETQRLESLDDGIQRFKDDLANYTTETGADGPQRALRAVGGGFPGLALRELEEAENQGVSTDRILALLVDLYCRTGQPEKANERISGRPLNDQALFSGPGTPAYRQGTVNFLLGFYGNAADLWRDYAIAATRGTQSSEGLGLGRSLLGGQVRESIAAILSLAGTPGQPGLVETQANWTSELAFCLLESGDPQEAGKQFLRAIELDPKIPIRPLIEDYLTRMDIPIPKAPGAEGEVAEALKAAPVAPAEPATPAPAAPGEPAPPDAAKPAEAAPKPAAPDPKAA